jgi:hypothetical protein
VPGGGYFYAGGPAAAWHVHYYSSSPAGCHLYTTTTTNPSPINWAAYYLPGSTQYDGSYYVDEFVPCDSHSATHSYRWYVYPYGTAYGYDSYLLNIDGSCNEYQQIIYQRFYVDPDAGFAGYVKQVDNTGVCCPYMAADSMWYA